jgi:nitrogen fixation/metabolism regulation signal transduction histidine kinase
MKLPQFVRWAAGIRWQWKVFIPIIAVLGLSFVALHSVLRSAEVHGVPSILFAAVSCAVLLCVVLLSVLLVLIEHPLEELMGTITQVRRGDLTARVSFAKREDDVGQLGQQFNEMIEQLDQNRQEIEEFHKREMARAEHLATLGELAAGLAHESVARQREINAVRMRQLLPAGSENWCKPEFRVTFGTAVEEILIAARESKADLIVMGAKPRKSLAGHVPLTIAYNVVTKAGCPVLTVRG